MFWTFKLFHFVIFLVGNSFGYFFKKLGDFSNHLVALHERKVLRHFNQINSPQTSQVGGLSGRCDFDSFTVTRDQCYKTFYSRKLRLFITT
jgi:hypothetical protein